MSGHGRRSTLGHGTKYRGAPGVSRTLGLGAFAVGADEPGVECLTCETRVQAKADGSPVAHARGGHKTDARKGLYRCEGRTT